MSVIACANYDIGVYIYIYTACIDKILLHEDTYV